MVTPADTASDTADRSSSGAVPLVVGSGSTEEAIRRYVRSPLDVLRLVVFVTVTLTLLALAIWVDDSITGLEGDIIELFGFVTPAVVPVLHGAVELLVVVATLIVYVVPLVTKRYRLFGYIVTASWLAGVLMAGAHWLVDREVSALAANELAARAGITDDVSSRVIGLAQLSALFITVGPFVTRRWRRAGAVTIGVIVLLRLLVSAQLPSDALLALPLGATCGTAVLLAFGRPDRHPTLDAIAAALADTGLHVGAVRPASVDARGSTPYFTTLEDGTWLFVKVLGSENRAADLLFRFYRMLRYKDVGDGRPFSSLRRTIEHEALIALLARDIGVRTPRLRGVADAGSDSMLLSYELIDGASLDAIPRRGGHRRVAAGYLGAGRDPAQQPYRPPRSPTGQRLGRRRSARYRDLDDRLRLFGGRCERCAARRPASAGWR